MPEGIIRDPKQNQQREHQFGIVYFPQRQRHYLYEKYLDEESRLCIAGENIEFEFLRESDTPEQILDGIQIFGEVEFLSKRPTQGHVNKRILHLINNNNRLNAIETAMRPVNQGGDNMPSDVRPRPNINV